MLQIERLIALRKEKGLLQKDLAKEMGLERTTYVKYETAGIQPPTDMIVRLANFFNVTTDYLLGETDNPSLPDEAADEVWELREELHKRPELKILFETSRKAKKEDIEFADKFLKGVTKENDYD